MRRILIHSRQLAGDRRGASAIEYGVLASLLALALVSALSSLGFGLKGALDQIGNAVAQRGQATGAAGGVVKSASDNARVQTGR